MEEVEFHNATLEKGFNCLIRFLHFGKLLICFSFSNIHPSAMLPKLCTNADPLSDASEQMQPSPYDMISSNIVSNSSFRKGTESISVPSASFRL